MRYLGFVLSIMLVGITLAAPLPTQIIVNNDTMQCARFLPGDECMDCTPPDGWEILEQYSSCPNTYTLIEVRGNCKGFEVEHCCTEGHSGASGDCRNMIKNDITKECAFLADAMNSTLSDGWQKVPENASVSNWLCPLDYTWTTLRSNNASTVRQYGSVNVVSVLDDKDFHVSSGNYVDNWTWLTQPGQFAEWTFYGLPTDRKLFIYLAPLVTRPSGDSGGSGYSTDARIKYGTRTGSRNVGVKKEGLLGIVRHPMYLSLIIYLWCQTFTMANVVVNIVLTVYIIIATRLEEKKLVLEFGDAYVKYQQEVPMFIPFSKHKYN